MRPHRTLLCLAPLACACAAGAAEPLPVPPCGVSPQPAYAVPGSRPNVLVANSDALRSAAPPACLGGPSRALHAEVALSGSFAHKGSVDELLARVGAISNLKGLRYWSVTDKQWRVLLTDASALEGRDPRKRRGDFTAAELRPGADLYFAETDSRSSEPATYRLHIAERSANGFTIEMENVTPIRFLFVPIFAPGELRTAYFVRRLDAGRWGYYSLVLVGSARGAKSEASLVNRAAALYRRFVGIADDAMPPLAS